ncbi:type II toxin-antitoxin system RelB/DinJ family antitoxin [Patescibacteria group bacterium]|nr:type II toxin-antitoxin system RelB/DinJ family antitoxin [Patescibacteria group bacterium]
MKTAVVNFKTTPEIKQRALENTKKAGIPLSLLLNNRLHQIANAKSLTLDFGAEEPSEMLIHDLEESKKDEKEGRVYKFDTADDSIAFLRSLRNKE